MLKGIDPRLNADVLYVLRAMGHGDTLILSDTNFPADSIAQQTVHGSLLRMENLTAAEAVDHRPHARGPCGSHPVGFSPRHVRG